MSRGGGGLQLGGRTARQTWDRDGTCAWGLPFQALWGYLVEASRSRPALSCPDLRPCWPKHFMSIVPLVQGHYHPTLWLSMLGFSSKGIPLQRGQPGSWLSPAC